jgi:hypothetical protein
MDIGPFRVGMFEFACGARMVGLWPNWSIINDMDLNHVCSREDVTEFCVDWTRQHEEFGDICVQLSALANGDYKKEHSKWTKLAKQHASSENQSVALSGVVDYAKLIARSPSVRKRKQEVNQEATLDLITLQLQTVWNGKAENPYADEKAKEERDKVSLE